MWEIVDEECGMNDDLGIGDAAENITHNGFQMHFHCFLRARDDKSTASRHETICDIFE